MQHTIHLAADEEEIGRCFPVLKQLRPHLDESALARQVVRQQAQGYFLVYLKSENEIRSVFIAGKSLEMPARQADREAAVSFCNS